MSRSPTPSSFDSDRCSEQIVFAEPNPHEAEYGSAPKSTSRTSSASPEPHAESSSMAIRPSSSLPTHTSSISRASRYDAYDLQPYSLMGAGPGFAVRFVPPYRHKPKPKAKATPPIEPVPATQTDRSLRSGFKRVKRLATRRSISSLDIFASADAVNQRPAVSTSALSSVNGQSSESIASTVVSTPSGDEGDEGRIVAHKIVGGIWEPQALGEVIPALRSLKVSGKLGF